MITHFGWLQRPASEQITIDKITMLEQFECYQVNLGFSIDRKHHLQLESRVGYTKPKYIRFFFIKFQTGNIN